MSPRRKRRNCRHIGGRRGFKPIGIPTNGLAQIVVELDEFEAIRHCDLEGKSQVETADEMGISRGTVQRLLVSGRAKIADALLRNQVIILNDGSIGGFNLGTNSFENCGTGE